MTLASLRSLRGKNTVIDCRFWREIDLMHIMYNLLT